MEKFARLFTVTNGAAAGWSSSNRTAFVLAVENNQLTMSVKSGRDPFCEEINTAFGRFMQEYEAEHGKVEIFARTHPYRFTFREGSSGCQTAFIEIDKGDGFPTRKRILDRSCFGKCGGMRLYVYDFLDLCVVDGFFEVDDNDYTYRYAEERDEFGKTVEMQSVRPRLTQYEEGWTYPGCFPERVVSVHNVVRDEPEAEIEPNTELDSIEPNTEPDPVEPNTETRRTTESLE